MPRLPRLVAIALLIAPLAARAQVAPAPAAAPARIDRPGFDLGLRLSYALPMGTVDGNDKLGDGVSSLIPLQVDALYRMNGQYAIGGYASYGFSFIKDSFCGYGASCSGSVLRVGVEGILRLAVPGRFIPWVGAGIGYEWLKIKSSSGVSARTVTLSGFELITLQGGGELLTSSDLSVGPFVSLSFGQYRSSTANGYDSGLSDRGFHEWFQIGIRGLFSL